jgi:hypothetical protein
MPCPEDTRGRKILLMEDEGKQNRANALRELVDMASHASERASEARKKFEQVRNRIVDNIDFEDRQHADAMRVNLETIFNLGHTAGEASETSIAVREQIEIMHKMEKVAAERDKAQAERDDRALAYSERQTKALEVIADYVVKS